MMMMPFFWHQPLCVRGEKKNRKEKEKKNKIVGSQLKERVFEVEVNIRGILLGRLNDVDDTESLLSPICWAPFYWAV